MAEEKKVTLNPLPGQTVVIWKEGTEENPEKPLQIKIDGHLKAPGLYLDAKKDLFKPLDCHCIIDQTNLSVKFFGNDTNLRRTEISGQLKPYKLLQIFNINGDNKFKSDILAKTLRKYPFLFNDVAELQRLINALINFSAKITVLIENRNDNQGNTKRSLETAAESQVPRVITFKSPLFEGEEEKVFNVNICCEATSGTIDFFFESPELIQLLETEKADLLEEQAKIFRDFGCAVVNV